MSHSSAKPVSTGPTKELTIKSEVKTLTKLLETNHEDKFVVKFILDFNGSFINEIVNNKTEINLLMWALSNDYSIVVGELLNTHINKNAVDKNGNNAMSYAAYGWANTIQKLKNFGMDVNHTNLSGYTPLMIAIKNNYFDTARYLLNAGANPSIYNNENKCAWDYIDNITTRHANGQLNREETAFRRKQLVKDWVIASQKIVPK